MAGRNTTGRDRHMEWVIQNVRLSVQHAVGNLWVEVVEVTRRRRSIPTSGESIQEYHCWKGYSDQNINLDSGSFRKDDDVPWRQSHARIAIHCPNQDKIVRFRK